MPSKHEDKNFPVTDFFASVQSSLQKQRRSQVPYGPQDIIIALHVVWDNSLSPLLSLSFVIHWACIMWGGVLLCKMLGERNVLQGGEDRRTRSE